MALTIPYTSREGIGRTPDAAGARPAPAEAFYNAGAAAAAKGLGNLANAAQGLNMQAHAETLRLREEELSLDMLKDMQAYQTEAAQFQDDYRANFQGENARDAAGQATAFHREKLQVLRETYGHNPQALQYVERHGGSLAASGVNAARAYGLGEHAKYKDSVHAGELELARGKLANWNTPPEEKAALYADLQKKTAALYGSRGLDGTAAGEKLAVFYKDCETQGQKEKLAYLRETDPAAAHKQVQEALTAFAPGGTAAGSGPRGIRNHNPGNIRRTDSPWEGEVAGADGNFKSFATPEHGIAALGNNLLAYEKKGITTVQGIINRWAPPVENDTGAYVARVAKELGVAPDASLNLHDPAVLAGLSRAIIAHENGGNPYTDAQVRAGVQAALGKAPLPAPQTIAPGTLVADAGNTPGGTGTDAGGGFGADAGRPGTGEGAGTTADAGGGFGAPRQDAPLSLSPEAALLARAFTPQQLAVELRTSESALRRQGAEKAHDLVQREKDLFAAFRSGASVDERRLPAQSEYVHAFGAEDGGKRHAELMNERQLGEDLSLLRSMTPEEQEQSLARHAAEPGAPGNAAHANRQHIREQALQQDRQMREKDPAAYVLRADTPGQGLFTALREKPSAETAAAYARAVQTGYAARGMAKDGPLLPKPMLEALGRGMMTAEPEQSAALIMQQRGLWGEHWPAVYGQLVSDKDVHLPAAAYVIGAGMEPEPATLLAQAAQNPQFAKQLKESLPDTVKEVDAQLPEVFEPLAETLRAQGGMKQEALVRESCRTLALQYASKGMDAQDAVEKAFKDIGGNRYAFQDGYRVPKGVDAQQVREGTASFLAEYGEKAGFFKPALAEAWRTSEEVDALTRKAIVAEARWVTAPDEQGLVLYRGPFAVQKTDGSLVRASWRELLDARTKAMVQAEKTAVQHYSGP